MTPLLFLSVPVVLYISVVLSWNYLWLIPVLILLGWFQQRKETLNIKTPTLYFWMLVSSCVLPIATIVLFDIVAVHQAVNNRYFSQLGLTFALIVTIVVGFLMAYLILNLKKELTILRQLLSCILVMVSFYIVSIGVATAGSNDVVSSQVGDLQYISLAFSVLSIVAGVVMAVYNVVIYKRTRSNSY